MRIGWTQIVFLELTNYFIVVSVSSVGNQGKYVDLFFLSHGCQTSLGKYVQVIENYHHKEHIQKKEMQDRVGDTYKNNTRQVKHTHTNTSLTTGGIVFVAVANGVVAVFRRGSFRRTQLEL